jgi:hypothetical protein
MIARMAGGTSTWETSSEKLSMPCCSASLTVMAVAGAVVSKPTAKHHDLLVGVLLSARRTASSGE